MQARYAEAEACAARSVSIMDELADVLEGPEADLILIEGLGRWGSALRQQGRYLEADAPLLRAVDLAEQHPDRALLAGALNEFGVLCKYSGRFEEGERAYGRALEIALELYGEMHPTVATVYHNIGGLEHARGDFAAGEAPARRACEIRREVRGPDHPDTVADECAYAGVLDGLERYAESRPIYERALVIFEGHYGAEHFEIAATLHDLAGVDAAEGDFEKAMERATRALAIKETLLGKEHPEWQLTARQLAAIMRIRVGAASIS